MNKAEALVRIKQVWNDRSVLLGNVSTHLGA